jgi:hypothetical protein
VQGCRSRFATNPEAEKHIRKHLEGKGNTFPLILQVKSKVKAFILSKDKKSILLEDFTWAHRSGIELIVTAVGKSFVFCYH